MAEGLSEANREDETGGGGGWGRRGKVRGGGRRGKAYQVQERKFWEGGDRY